MRIGVAGGDTDLPAWAAVSPGRCLSLAIRAHTHAVVVTRQDREVVASYTQLDVARAATEIANGLIRETALQHGFLEGFEVHTISAVPSFGSGLGASSSIAVCLAAAFRGLRELTSTGRVGQLDERARGHAAREAWSVEIDRLRRPIGKQDHMAAAWGGLRVYSFYRDEASVERTFSDDDARWLAGNLMLVRLPSGHDSRAILSGVKDPLQMAEAFEAVDVAVRAIETRSCRLLGEALRMGQESKRSISGAVTQLVSDVVARVGEVDGVEGCKVAGAGGGGHVVVAAAPSAAPAVSTAAGGLETFGVEPDLDGLRGDGWL